MGAMEAEPKVSIVAQDDYREGYANSVQVRGSLWDFFLQFGTLGKQTPQEVEIHAFQGIYLSPQQAKALYTVLGENIKQYEATIGEIRLAPGQMQAPQATPKPN